MTRKTVLLDFDGTIADTFHVGHSIAKKVCVYITETEYRKFHEGNVIEQVNLARAKDHGDRCDHALDWLGAYLPEFKIHARPFAGMPELIKELSRTYRLFVVSSTHDDLIQHFLEVYGLQDVVEGIYGFEKGPRKDEKLRTIFSAHGISAGDCVFVTDTLGDVNEVSLVEVRSIGVTWGFQDRATLERGNPFRVIDSPEELTEAIAEYFASME